LLISYGSDLMAVRKTKSGEKQKPDKVRKSDKRQNPDMKDPEIRKLILELCDAGEGVFTAMRRELHRIPEASFAEHRTAKKIGSYLKATGIRHKRGVGGTGIVGVVDGGPGPVVALRTDMDALNLEEQTGLSFASCHRGFMHACGHDAHMAIVLGAGIVLKQLGNDLPGSKLPGKVKLIFQPAEETPPGGAIAMIRAGAMKAPKVGAVIGLHVDPEIPVGKIAINEGYISAAADDFKITIRGKGGHGSSPHRGIDTVVVAAQFVTALQSIVARRVGPLESVVVSVGYIRGGERDNIIAAEVEMGGTVRTRTPALRRKVPAMIRQTLKATCSQFGARGEMKYIKGYPPVYCDPAFTSMVAAASGEILGRRTITTSPGLEMGGEDFAYFAEEVPGTTMFVGVGNRSRGKTAGLHTATFDIDEDALKIGVAAMAYSAYKYLEKGKGK
jgi:amidohydrolase